jgi:serine/threonine-protein kinase RsbW
MPTSAAHPAAGSPGPERLQFDIPSVLTRGREVQDAILDACRRHGFGDDAYFAVKLSLDEAVTNAIKHGNELDPNKRVLVEAAVSPKQLHVEVRDEGPGFDPNKVPDPTLDENLGKCSGRGLLLIEAYMSDVSWSTDGRTIKMTKLNAPERPTLPKAG